MTHVIRAAWVCAVAALCFAAAVLAGVDDGEARASDAGPAPPVCCIYLIF